MKILLADMTEDELVRLARIVDMQLKFLRESELPVNMGWSIEFEFGDDGRIERAQIEPQWKFEDQRSGT